MIKIKEESNGVRQGGVFNSWTVLGKPFRLYKQQYGVVTQCKCGFVAVVYCSSLKQETSKCCKKCAATKHGEFGTRLYGIWGGLKTRCNNKQNQRYLDYGGRGIKICQEWNESFEAFRDWSLKNGYKNNLEIDRKDNDSDYCPENCHWTTHKTNSRNKRNNRLITAFGETKCLSAWVEDDRCKVERDTLKSRLKLNWDIEKAITTPPRAIRYKQ